jgi:hypothetical protein
MKQSSGNIVTRYANPLGRNIEGRKILAAGGLKIFLPLIFLPNAVWGLLLFARRSTKSDLRLKRRARAGDT